MLIADDERRWVAGNDAACKLFGISREDVPWRTMDEMTSENERRKLAERWRAFLSLGAAEGWYQLDVPNRGSVPVEFSAIANVLTARHLMVFVTPDDASIAHGRSGSERAAAWAPVALEGKGRVQLTKRESEVMTLIAAGGRSEDIASQLFVSSETIKSHVHNALAKLGAHTRAHAVAIALVTGEIELSMFDALSSAPSFEALPR